MKFTAWDRPERYYEEKLNKSWLLDMKQYPILIWILMRKTLMFVILIFTDSGRLHWKLTLY